MALGHWLKDYIGPRASAGGSGGGTEPLIVRFTGETETVSSPLLGDETYNLVDASAQDVFTALQNGRSVQLFDENTGYQFANGYVPNQLVNFYEGSLKALSSGRLGMLVNDEPIG